MLGHHPFAWWTTKSIARGYSRPEIDKRCEKWRRLCYVEEREDGVEVLVRIFPGELGNVCDPARLELEFKFEER